MAGHGPQPTNDPVRPTPTARVASKRIPAGGFKGKTPPLQGRHCRQTEAWYATWRTSPQAAMFLATDWQRLQMLALLVDALYDPHLEPSKKTSILSEIRQNESKLGATAADRNSMYLTLQPDRPEEAVPAAQTAADPAKDAKKGRARLKVVAADPVDQVG